MSSIPAGHFTADHTLANGTEPTPSPLVHLARGAAAWLRRASDTTVTALLLLPLVFGTLGLRLWLAVPPGTLNVAGH